MKKLNKNQSILFFILSTMIVVISIQCGKQHHPLESEKIDYPPVPQNLEAKIGDGKIELAWTMKDTQDIIQYFVYRKDSANAAQSLLDSTTMRRYADRDLNNGKKYRYQVSAINAKRVEGPLSRSITIMPNIYDLIIENGRKYTNQNNVSLTLTAPMNTELMKISNDSAFSEASWEVFAREKIWELPGKDGDKYVYATFRDKNGNETIEYVKDKIVLDTKAIIYDLQENSKGTILKQDDTLHIALESKETDGEATVDIGTVRRGIQLYDNGQNGDQQKEDGIYELDYIIPYGLEVEDATIKGHFEDAAGNEAESITTLSKITVQASPKSVTLYAPTPINNSYTSLNLSWSKSNESDFSMYKLFRSQSAGVTPSSTLVTTIEDRNQINYDDENLKENSTYYYKLYVYDNGGAYTGSNEVEGKTNENEPPTPVDLNSPSPMGDSPTSLNLSWSQNTDPDFASYKVFQAEQSNVDSSSTLLATITDRSITSYEAANLEEGKTYYFRVYVFDTGGLSSGSDVVSGLINPQDPPEAVTLFAASKITSSSITISWSQNYDDSFAAYRIFRSESSQVDSNATLDTTIINQQLTIYTSNDLEENTTYYFRVYVYNQKGLSSASNIINATTEVDEPPEAVTLHDPDVNKTDITLSWSENTDDDFASYKIFRAETTGVSVSSQLIKVITEKYNTLFTDGDLEEDTEYFYKIVVYDQAGNYTESNEVSATTEQDEPPTAVDLFNPTEITQSSIHLSWSSNTDDDFASYRIFRSETPGVTTTSQFVSIIIDQTVTFYNDTELKDSTTYYYKIFVYDAAGNFSESNEISATTEQNEPPESVTLAQPTVKDSTTLRLTWSVNDEEDFHSYRLFRATSSPVDTSVAPIVVINDDLQTEYVDSNLEEGTQYYYVIKVYDQAGLSSISNEVNATPK